MRRIHTAGIACLLLVTAATLAGLHWFGFNGLLLGVTNMRWLTGLTGLLAIAATLAYPWRRRRFVKRAGPLRYWMLGHVYFGALGAVEILLHGGARSGGALTTALAISFDLVLLTGLWGILCYRLVPRRLHRLEPGTPLLADDLESRRQELVADLAVTSEPARRFVEAAADRFSSLAFLLRQFDPSASLHQTTAAAHAEFAAELENLPPEDRLCSTRALDALVALPRVHALRFLHGLLKSWLIPHVAATSLMLALLAVHIFQAIYGAR